MKYVETSNNGSFSALGTAFIFEFDAHTASLTVSCARSLQTLQRLSLGPLSSADALAYVNFFHKAAQIKALKYSNNGSLSLEKVFPDQLLLPLIERVSHISTYAVHLNNARFMDFYRDFQEHHPHIREFIVKTSPSPSGASFFACSLTTQKGSTVSSRSSTLHAAISYLSDKIVQEIIVREFSFNHDAGIHKLMATASTLLTLALTLNEGFDPKNRAKSKTTPIFSRIANIKNIPIDSDA